MGIFPWITLSWIFLLYVRQTWKNLFIAVISNVRGYLRLIRKDCFSYAWSCSLCEGGTFFCRLILRKLGIFYYVFDWLYFSFGVSLLFPLSITFFVFLHSFWHCISSITDEILSINSSAYVFVLGGFNVHPKDWLTYSG